MTVEAGAKRGTVLGETESGGLIAAVPGHGYRLGRREGV